MLPSQTFALPSSFIPYASPPSPLSCPKIPSCPPSPTPTPRSSLSTGALAPPPPFQLVPASGPVGHLLTWPSYCHLAVPPVPAIYGQLARGPGQGQALARLTSLCPHSSAVSWPARCPCACPAWAEPVDICPPYR